MIGRRYKIMAYLLACGRKQVLSYVISFAQRAFVNGKQILDGLLVSNECMVYYTKNEK